MYNIDRFDSLNMKKISKLISQINPSPTLEIDLKVKELQLRGDNVINLGIGEPNFDTPHIIKDYAIQSIKDGFTHYTNTSGILELKEAICNKLKIDNNIIYSSKEIIVGPGTKFLLYSALLCLCNKNDEVIIPIPTWSTYVEQVKLVGAIPKFTILDSPFKLTLKKIEKAASKKTKVIILNSPSNPTGAIIEKSELEAISEFALENDIWIISDEIYEQIVFNTTFTSIASLNDKIRRKTITINGFSKIFAMTGWRIGYAAGDKKIIDMMTSFQGHTTSNAASISQKAAIVGLQNRDEIAKEMVAQYSRRRELIINLLTDIKEISFHIPEGSFYFFIDIKNIIKKEKISSQEWCEQLLEEKKVAVIAGEAFFCPGYFRLSFGASTEDIKEGIKRIREFILKK